MRTLALILLMSGSVMAFMLWLIYQAALIGMHIADKVQP